MLGLGTVKFGRTAKVKYPQPFKLPSDGQIADLLATAKALGINLLDTAPAYGTSEARLGEALEGARDDWLLCTKVGEQFDGARSHHEFGESAILSSVTRSLKRLRTDTLDLVLIHSDGRPVADLRAAGTFTALRHLQHQGVIKAIGFSGKTATDASAALPDVDVLMCAINARYRDEAPIAHRAAAAGVGVLVKKPLDSGHRATPQDLTTIAALPGVTALITGTLSPDHLIANATALNRPGAAPPSKSRK